MGVTMIRDRRGSLLVGEQGAAGEPTATVVRRGIRLNLLNPKKLTLFFAFLPQFLGSSSQRHVASWSASGGSSC